jgi:signal transduction histidine kinase
MMRNWGIAFRLTFLILVGSIVVLGLTLGYNYVVVREIIIKDVGENAQNLAQSTVNRVEAVLSATAKIPENLAEFLGQSNYSQDQLLKLIRSVVENNPEVYGSGVAFEPYAFDGQSYYFAPYYHRSHEKLEFINLGSDTYRYFTMDWYQIPKELGRATWSEPYYDEGGGGIVMSTYSVPFYKTEGGTKRFMGVVTVDVSLQWLQAIVSSIRISQTGYAFLISQDGVIVTHPMQNLIMNETIFSLAEARHSKQLREIGRAMIRGQSGFVPTTSIVSEKPCWMVYAPVPANGWSLAALFPQDELMANVTHLNHIVWSLAVAGTLLLLIIVASVARSITGPLTALTSASESLAQGNLDGALPTVTSNDEVGRLTAAFAHMQRVLKQYITDLKETSAARERAAAELEEYSRTLEHKVEMRTQEIQAKNTDLENTLNELKNTQEKLIVQEKLASLGALTAGIAHEIKNPLNFVTNFAELSVELVGELREVVEAQQDRLEPKDREDLGAIIDDLQLNMTKITEHGKRADNIVRGMLQHSRGKSGDPVPTDLNALLAEYVALAYHGMRAQDASFNITLETSYDPAVGMVAVVPQDISRVFLNIINNACYAAHEKRQSAGAEFSPTVRVQTADLGDHVRISIRDNGVGIPAAIREKIFNPFFTTKPPGKGTGLGLSITYDIVRQHKGEIHVESEEGSYTEFVIVLPKKAS